MFKNDIRPFAREVVPTITRWRPACRLAGLVPQLASSFSVLNELFNEIAYNPGKTAGGFLFFLDWDLRTTSTACVSSADANGVLGGTLLYINCGVLPILSGVAKIDPTVNILVGLTNPPSKAACANAGILEGATAAAARAQIQGACRRPVLRPRQASARVRSEGLI